MYTSNLSSVFKQLQLELVEASSNIATFFSYGLSFYSRDHITCLGLGGSDAPVSWQIFFQQPASPIMEGIIEFHNDLMVLIVFVLFFVGSLLAMTVYTFSLPTRVVFADTHDWVLEVVWTVYPAVALLLILGPSLGLLYAMDEVTDPSVNVKVIGHQWYWVYEYGDMLSLSKPPQVGLRLPTETIAHFNLPIRSVMFSDKVDFLLARFQLTVWYPEVAADPKLAAKTIGAMGWVLSDNFGFDSVVLDSFLYRAAPWFFTTRSLTEPEIFFAFFGTKQTGVAVPSGERYSTEDCTWESYMIADDDLVYTTYRLLDVDRRLVLPTLTHIRLLITSADVIHSWAVPSLGIKVDAVPGRLNQIACFIKRAGVFFGQCSELCGVNHGFMPVVVSAVSR